MAIDLQKLRINRDVLAKFLPDARSIRQFETLLDNFRLTAEEIIATQAATAAANAAAASANAAAAAADAVAVQVTLDSSLANSFTSGLTITATDAGANVTIAMSAHTRVYGDGTSVAVSAGNVLALAYSTSYWVYYIDASRTGGAVTYLASTSVQGNGTIANGHFIGAVITPAAAAPPEAGIPVLPPGGVLP